MSKKPIIKTSKIPPALVRAGEIGKSILGKTRSFDQINWPGVPYGNHPNQKMELYELNDLCPRDGWPTVLLIHGGGWVEGGPEQFNLLAPLMVKQGIMACSIRYRLAVDNHWSKALEDVEKAVDFVLSQQVDPNRIALWGESAGGHLALLYALKHPDRIKCVVGVGTPIDLTTTPRDLTEDVFLETELYEASPFHKTGPLPQTLLLHGTLDSVVPFKQAEQFHHKRPQETEILSVDGGNHTVLWPPVKAYRARKKAVKWLVQSMDLPHRGSKWKRRKKKKKQ